MAVYNVSIFIKSVVITLCDLRTEDSSEGSVEIVYVEFDLLRLWGFECEHHLGKYLCFIDGLFKLEIKCICRVEVEVALAVCERIFENCAHIDLCSLAVGSEILLAEEVGTSDKLIYCTDSELCHIFTHFLCNKGHKVYDIFGFALETLAEFGVLCCNAYGAGVKVADSHHYAAHCYQRSGSEAVFLCAEHCCDDDITSRHHLAVRFNDNS